MRRTTSKILSPISLRHLAETKSDASELLDTDEMSVIELKKILHELQVHQIELEMQNDELSRIRQDLEVSRARYVDLYDLAPVGYLTFNADGLIIEANFTAATQLGVERDHLPSQMLAHFIFNEDLKEYYLFRDKIILERIPQDFELRLRRPDQSFFWAHLRAIAMSDGEYWIALSNISEQKKAEADRVQILGQLIHSAKLASIGTLAAGIAHEINNPLMVISGNIELGQAACAAGGPTFEKLGTRLKVIERASTRIQQIIFSLRTYSRQDTDQVEVIDVHRCILETFALLAGMYAHENIHLNTELVAKNFKINANFGKLQQVLINLVGNAHDALLGRSFAQVTISTVNRGIYLIIAVTDNGSGIATKDLPFIFDPFYTTKDPGKGTGLGLSISQTITQSFRGNISVTSEINKGSKFELRFTSI
jgi:two-component system cell cycle sensor histidine kinase/response regulator CckA